jgi:hypothetical protein
MVIFLLLLACVAVGTFTMLRRLHPCGVWDLIAARTCTRLVVRPCAEWVEVTAHLPGHILNYHAVLWQEHIWTDDERLYRYKQAGYWDAGR